MSEHDQVVTAAEMDTVTPQQRADAVDAGIVRDWTDVDPAFRDHVETRARRLARELKADA